MPETVQESGTEQDNAEGVAVAPIADGEVSADAEPEADVESGDDSDSGSEEDGDERSGGSAEDLLVREGDIAGDYLERLLDLVDYDGDIDLDVEAGRAIVSIDGGDDLEKLVGPRGNVLEAVQELTRLAVQQETGTRSRLMLDIAGWRADRREELRDLGRATAERVLSGEEERIRLQPMTPFERKVVHDAVAAVDGVHSESEGEDPRRRVVVFRQT
ncbi:protein jag [Actinophytocola xinjiangensis]|uniref:Jag family protein n=1 Tax=Actinophytocola xinjiangensis TaxID=485602 RepID=UPI000A726635|nr:R3H domain-containing nucleic acid-binding protein [Actinophytocola xinjiangensis]